MHLTCSSELEHSFRDTYDLRLAYFRDLQDVSDQVEDLDLRLSPTTKRLQLDKSDKKVSLFSYHPIRDLIYWPLQNLILDTLMDSSEHLATTLQKYVLFVKRLVKKLMRSRF
jgi:hypothetical protein